MLRPRRYPHTNQGGCNCSKPEDCLLDGQCLTSCIVYNAEVSTAEKEYIYHGSTKNTWKERYGGHKTSFTHRQYEHATTLSKLIWKLKDNNTPYTIKWSIAAFSPGYFWARGEKIIYYNLRCFLDLYRPKSLVYKRILITCATKIVFPT